MSTEANETSQVLMPVHEPDLAEGNKPDKNRAGDAQPPPDKLATFAASTAQNIDQKFQD